MYASTKMSTRTTQFNSFPEFSNPFSVCLASFAKMTWVLNVQHNRITATRVSFINTFYQKGYLVSEGKGPKTEISDTGDTQRTDAGFIAQRTQSRHTLWYTHARTTMLSSLLLRYSISSMNRGARETYLAGPRPCLSQSRV